MRLKSIFRHRLFFPILVTLIYFVVNLLLVLHHEPWRDEVNPWQVSKAMNLGNMFDVMQGEAHPLLWYFILAPFAKLGLPLITTNTISLVILSIAVFLVARYAPFSKKMIILITLSSAFMYFNPVISRNYCLVVLGIVVAAIAYKDRFKHPIRYALALALICQSHFLAIGLAAVLTIMFIVEYLRKFGIKKMSKLVAPLLIIGSSVAVSLPIVLAAMSSHTVIAGSEMTVPVDLLPQLNYSLYNTVLPIFQILAVIVVVYLYFAYPKQLLILAGAVASWLFVMVFVYKVPTFSEQKGAVLVLFTIFAFWTTGYEKPRKPTKLLKAIRRLEIFKLLQRVPATLIFAIALILTLPATASSATYDWSHEYGYSQRIAQYINENTPPGAIVLVGADDANELAIGFVPFLNEDRRIFDIATGDFMEYYIYRVNPEIFEADVATAVERFAGEPLYFIDFAPDAGLRKTFDAPWQVTQSFTSENESIPEQELNFYQVTD